MQGCISFYDGVEPVSCELGDPTGGIVATIIGDSHAMQLIPALDIASRDAGIKLVPFMKTACAVSSVPVYNATLKRNYHECEAWRERVFEQVEQLQPDYVIVIQSSHIQLDGVSDEDRDRVFHDGWVTTLNRLRRSGAEVILLSDTPYALQLVPECLSAHMSNAAACTMSRDEGTRLQNVAVESARGVRNRRSLRSHRRARVRSDTLPGDHR